jgi:hypothetical protein
VNLDQCRGFAANCGDTLSEHPFVYLGSNESHCDVNVVYWALDVSGDGGRCLNWVKENLPESWSMTFRWMDLSDWLSYRATGDDTRSLCTTVCKWTYLGHVHIQQTREKTSRNMEACG